MKDRWKNRRHMAWLALIAGLSFPLLVLFTDSTELGELATAFYLFVAAVVGSYMGFATMDDKFQRNYYDDNNSDPQANSPMDYRRGIPREDARDYTQD
jgi:hypothetical protein